MDRSLGRTDMDNVAFFRSLEQQYQTLQRQLAGRALRFGTPESTPRASQESLHRDSSAALGGARSRHSTPLRDSSGSGRRGGSGPRHGAREGQGSSGSSRASLASKPHARNAKAAPPSVQRASPGGRGGGARSVAEAQRAATPEFDGWSVGVGSEVQDESRDPPVLEAIAAAVGEAPDSEWARASVRGRLAALSPGMARQASLMPELLRATLLLGLVGNSAHGATAAAAMAVDDDDGETGASGLGSEWSLALRACAVLLHADAVLVYARGSASGSVELCASWSRGGRPLSSVAALAMTIARRVAETGAPVVIDSARPNALLGAGCALSVALGGGGGASELPLGVLQAFRWRGGGGEVGAGGHELSFVYPPDAPAIAAILAAAAVPAVLRAAQSAPPLPHPPAAPMEDALPAGVLPAGARVLAERRARGELCSATVLRYDRSSECYAVLYDTGESEAAVPRARVRSAALDAMPAALPPAVEAAAPAAAPAAEASLVAREVALLSARLEAMEAAAAGAAAATAAAASDALELAQRRAADATAASGQASSMAAAVEQHGPPSARRPEAAPPSEEERIARLVDERVALALAELAPGAFGAWSSARPPRPDSAGGARGVRGALFSRSSPYLLAATGKPEPREMRSSGSVGSLDEMRARREELRGRLASLEALREEPRGAFAENGTY